MQDSGRPTGRRLDTQTLGEEMNTSTTEVTPSGIGSDQPDPDKLVAAAIAAADYGNKGAPFAPFMVKLADPADFVNGWTARRGNAISFYGSYKGDSTGFLPLGDFAAVADTPIEETPILLLAPMPDQPMAPPNGGNPSLPTLAHPTDFTWIADDIHSGNQDNIAYYWPTAPKGYKALGICLGFNGQVPDVNKYWCVNDYYLQKAQPRGFWSDTDSHWTSHNGSLSAPSLTGARVQDEKVLLAPTTMLSDQHGNLENTSWAIHVEKLLLPVPGASVPFPDYNPEYTKGTRTSPGLLSKVAVLPSTLIEDRSPGISPFYYLAGQPEWVCARAFPSPKGATYSDSFLVGSTQESSSGFQDTTSVTVGAEVGIEAGPVSANVSVSYTKEMQLTGSTSSGTETRQSKDLSIVVPKAERVLIWQKATDFVIYRTAGDRMSSVEYQTDDIVFSDSNPK